MIFEHFHFIRPHWLWLLCLVPPILWAVHRYLRDNNTWLQICEPKLLSHLLVQRPGTNHRVLLYSIAAAWLLGVIAFAGPSWSHLPQPVFRSKSARVIVLDMSPSMAAEDISPSRAARAVYKIIDVLQRENEGQTGMVVFTDVPFVVSPLTDDNQTIESMIPALTPEIMPSQGSNISAALNKAAILLQQAGYSRGEIFLISDSKAEAKAISTAKQLQHHGYITSVLSIGTKEGGPIRTKEGFVKDSSGNIIIAKQNDDSLKKIASAGRGRFAHFTNDDSDINHLFNSKLSSHALTKARKIEDEKTAAWRDEGNWFVLALLPFLLVGFRRGWLSEIVK